MRLAGPSPQVTGVIYILATVMVGVLASIAPARRAARIDILAAIATE